ncbi:hypothetical protein [Pelovirga terrestris]|uniref:Uncharacterized protein n=1 Tax=Pelovirga terrestris TaxID=2771352 RepID=A0A8J6UL31_9BACT|nr:hypothetical protein [Pelovirga terrestris]MBD1400472.1 hypothetical protein [Pelovirga terrestris]
MSDLPAIAQTILSAPGVLRIIMLDQRGVVRAQAGEKDERKLADYISFISVTSTQLRTYLNISAPHNARVTLSSGQALLILFGEELTAGILLEQDTDYFDIIDNFASIVNEMKL